MKLREQYDTCVSGAVNESVAAVGNENLSNYHRNRKISVFASNRN